VEALIVIDMLNDFVTGKLKAERAKRIVPNIKRLIQVARTADVPIIYANDAHLPADSELKKWGKHAMKGTRGAEVIPQLKPNKGDYVLEKRTYSGFFETGLDLLLRELNVDSIVLTGLHANMCIRQDATEALSEQEYQQGLEYLKEIYDAEITETDRLVRRWSGV